MKRTLVVAAVVSLALACATVPLTGRRQLSLVSSSDMLAMSAQQYGEFLNENPPSRNAEATARVERVGRRIEGAVERYMRENGMADRLRGYDWQFRLVDDNKVNAWCMPGGRVVVYSGLLPVAGDDTGLAVVMGHEIAHAIAEHGNERMSQALLAQMGGVALSVALNEKPAETRNLYMAAYGAGAHVGVLLPFSRLQESEADRLGLRFMAMAGYDPRQAPAFWERMAAGKSGSPPELLSTHPSDATRIGNLKQWIPEAMKVYAPGG